MGAPHAVVEVPVDVWPAFARWAEAIGLTLERVPAGPAQLPRFHVWGPPRYTWPGNLTDRESQVLTGMARGCTNGEIGQQLFLSPDTVKTHARKLFRKLGVKDRSHAVHVAHGLGLLTAVKP